MEQLLALQALETQDPGHTIVSLLSIICSK